MQLYKILRDSISLELMKARHECKLRQQTVAEKCGMTVSELDDLELGLKLLCYPQYEKLLSLYKKRTEVILEDKEDA